jgi:hypothetical protein
MPRKKYTKWNPNQEVLDPRWYGDPNSPADVVWRGLPEEEIQRYAQKLELERFRFDHFHSVLHKELGERKIVCPHQRQAYENRLRRLFTRGKRKYPEMDKNPQSGGRPGIEYAAYLQAKVLAPFYEVEDNSEALHREMGRNGPFLVTCAFYENQLPSVRTLQYYEQVMIWGGLWHQWKKMIVNKTYKEGLWEGKSLAVDPTHATDYANVNKTSVESKECNCLQCQKDPVPTCDQTNIVSKSKNFKVPGVKVGIVTDSDSELPLVAQSFNARTFDGKMGAELLRVCKGSNPQVNPEEVSLDSAFDGVEGKEEMKSVYTEATFFIDSNPRRRKPKPLNDPFVQLLSPKGIPLCKQGEMRFYTRNLNQERYVFTCPRFDPKLHTNSCPLAKECCGGESETRYKTIPRSQVPYVDWDNPHFSHYFKEHYNKRSATERVNARLKWLLPFDRVWTRGKLKLQAHWDKMIAAFHLFAYAMKLEGIEDRFRCLLHPYPEITDTT